MVSLVKITRLFHTVRHLRFEQICYRFYYYFRKLSLQPISTSFSLRPWTRPWHAPAWQRRCQLDAEEFIFLGEKGRVDAPVDWNNPHKSKLWLYNLHYLDVLNTVGADSREIELTTLIRRWRRDNPPLAGNGWEPYPLSLRLVNLIKWHARHGAEHEDLECLAMQAQALERQIEFHILGNHLFSNCKALIFVGVFLAGEHSDRWLDRGLKILDRELYEQFLTDGGHLELSPMYHATLLWDLCDLVRLAEVSGLYQLQLRVERWREVILRGLSWLQEMVHPDGEISFFNDAAFGIAPRLDDLRTYAGELNCVLKDEQFDALALSHLDASGYVVVHLGHKNKALLDVAEVGPSCQPGHAHADTLSFEMSLDGRRLFVNSGTSRYGNDAERHRQRGTQAHNTLYVDGKNSSEVWAGFRMARRAHPKNLSIKQNSDQVVVSAAHDGYRRLPGRVWHWRQWDFSIKSLVLVDRLKGAFNEAEAHFYLHPEVDCFFVEGEICQLFLPSGRKVDVSFSGAGKVRLKDTTWHPGFGVSVPNKCLVAQLSKDQLVTNIEW